MDTVRLKLDPEDSETESEESEVFDRENGVSYRENASSITTGPMPVSHLLLTIADIYT
jgi:hypothetical protein